MISIFNQRLTIVLIYSKVALNGVLLHRHVLILWVVWIYFKNKKKQIFFFVMIRLLSLCTKWSIYYSRNSTRIFRRKSTKIRNKDLQRLISNWLEIKESMNVLLLFRWFKWYSSSFNLHSFVCPKQYMYRIESTYTRMFGNLLCKWTTWNSSIENKKALYLLFSYIC